MAHGEAVAVGLVYAAHLALVLGRIDKARVEQHYDVVGGVYQLATALPDFEHDLLLALMERDKKALHGLTFVLDGERGVEVVSGVEVSSARQALQMMSNR